MITIDVYTGTISAELYTWGCIKKVLQLLDTKHGIIASETGKSGYNHYQYTVECSGDLLGYVTTNNLGWHVEKCTNINASWDYCKKDGRYKIYNPTSTDKELRRINSFELNKWQNNILYSVESQNDRAITVWIDIGGGHGKTVLWHRLVDRGRVLPVPRSRLKSGRLSAWICDAWKNHEIIWIDIPRSRSLDADLCGELEELKDGMAFDDRYGAHWKCIRGTKILVTTNNYIDKTTYKSLTPDRWDIHTIVEDDSDGSELSM
ncbi:replication associated protein [Chlorocebus cynosuros associated smacovirus]|uniref:Replication associated protein n=1 Tax=Chlorocebus cynosuros associated smacovirus TaxID=2213167 RepID=A0A455R6D8_9VIRU|nr:replication associated protein [Chlorocebus cynosuros associated smacovirus]BBE29370.1 replication associated protein [Chlorocebus cynosuros associated smacovirus]